MELDSNLSSDSSSVSMREYNMKNCCRPDFRSKWVRNKGAILVLVWIFLGFSVYHYFTMHMHSKQRDPVPKNKYLSGGELIGTALVYPIGGWLADAYFGRYRVIRCGMWIMWFGAMLNGCSLVIGMMVTQYGTFVDPWIAFTTKVIMGIGFGAFQANIIQFGVDQLLDAPSTEVTAFIMWNTLLMLLSGNVLYFSSDCNGTYAPVLVIAVLLSLLVCSNFLFSKWLNKEQIISNPLSQIAKVVYVTVKMKHRSRLAIGLNNRGVLSWLNIAKRVYNGPFTDEQVEDVKTFFRMMVVALTFTISCSGIPTVITFMRKLAEHLQNWPNGNCYATEAITYFLYIFPVVTVPIYKLLIEPLFCSCLPTLRITSKFYFLVLLFLCGVLSLLGIESASYYHQLGLNVTAHKCIFLEQVLDNQSAINVYWVLLPSALIGLSIYLAFFSGIQFVCAQAPLNMKGLIIGLSFALYGSMSVIQTALSIPFVSSPQYLTSWQRAPLTCGMWFLILEGVIVLAGFLVVVVIVKTYKRRKRLNLPLQSDIYDTLSE